MITYPPEMLPRADADDEAEVIVQELEDLRADNERLRTALTEALRYVEAVVFNTPHRQKQQNYRDCAIRIKAALSPHQDGGAV